MKPFILMITFLTRIPIKINFEINKEDFKSGIWYIPVVGLLIGYILYAIYFLAVNFINPLVLSFLLLIIYILITGGLHIDGMADAFDALGSNRDRNRMLEIMSDSHIGTFGTLSIAVYCIGITVLLAKIPSMCLIFPVLGRSLTLFSCSISKYAKTDGLGKTIIDNAKAKHVLFSMVILLLAAALAAFAEKNILLAVVAIISSLISFIIIWIITKNISKKLDGITGDIIGYVIEISSVIFLLSSYIVYEIIGYL